MKSHRYQLRKEAVGVALRHPWIFRDHLSSAASVLRDGALLRLVDGHNQVIGYGIYEASGAIAIRIVRRGAHAPDAAWLRAQLRASVAKRAALAERTDAIRLIHGESDGLPAVVVDRFADTLVVSSYSTGADRFARYAAHALDRTSPIVGPARHVLIRPARLRRASSSETSSDSHPLEGGDWPGSAEPEGAGTVPSINGSLLGSRTVRGTPPGVVHITEDGLRFAVDLAAGQKTGTYLDLRGLRRELAATPLAGARVLNLFAYSGMLGRAVEHAGAASITQVDASQRALAFAAAHHVGDPARHTFVTADVFEWLPALTGDPFDLVIVDPPAMTTKASQVPGALAAYRKLYRAAAPHVRPGGTLVAVCCTSRIDRAAFHRTLGAALGPAFSMHHEIPAEPDHPIGFPQADYLKIAWWTRAS